MISAFIPLVLLGYASVELQGSLLFFPRAAMVAWAWLTVLALRVWIPETLRELKSVNRLPGFLTGQTIFQIGVVAWLSLLHSVSAPGPLLLPSVSRLFPQALPMILSITLYSLIFWESRRSFQEGYGEYLDPDQTPEEFFRARMTLPILFFPPMLLWMAVEDLTIDSVQLAGLSDIQSFLLAPLFFVFLYLLSPHLFNLAWRASEMGESDLTRKVKDLAEKASTRITGIKVWDTFREPVPNAAVAGLSDRFRYVYITQYLLDIFDQSQLTAVVAHELGHLKLGHVWTYLIFSLDLIFFSFLVKLKLFLGFPDFLAAHESLDSSIDLVIFLAVFLLLFTALTRRSEVQADRFAVSLVGAEPFVSSLETLREFILPPPARLPWWTLTHPDFPERIERAKNWKGTVSDVLFQSRMMRGGLVIVGFLIVWICWAETTQVLSITRGSKLLSRGEAAQGLEILQGLPPGIRDHPEVVQQLCGYAGRTGQWSYLLRGAVSRTWGGRVPDPGVLKVFQHPASPEVALYLEFVQFLLQTLDLRGGHGISLFDEVFDHLQIAFRQG